MIDASFSRAGRDATVSGAYQYDTGQRLRMYGLPSPPELAGRDDFLSGDVVSVQAQYAFVGDEQTEMRHAEWREDEENGNCWVAAIPDVYLLKNQDVHLYVYVSYGQTEDGMRSKTIYEAVFRPISRPAPSTNVTPDQTNAWDALVQEVNLAIAATRTATSDANAATETTVAAVNAAGEAADRANAAGEETENYLAKLERTEVSAEYIGADASLAVSVEDETGADGDYKNVMFQFPRRVAKVNGVTVGEDFSITLTPDDVGAMPATKQTVFEFTATIPANMNGSEGISVDVAGMLATDRPIVDINMSSVAEGQRADILDAWSEILIINALDGRIGIIYADATSVAIPIRLLCVR